MTEMIERAATALRNACATVEVASKGERSLDVMVDAEMLAETVIEALKEPTVKMLQHMDGYTDLRMCTGLENSAEARQGEMRAAWLSAILVALGKEYGQRKAPPTLDAPPQISA